MNTIENIASKHLGKAGDGTIVKPYVTPTAIDKSLLVAIPRNLNREEYGLNTDPLIFVGHDVWNCYEVSILLQNGFPVNFVVKIVYPSDSPNIVESKSLKLYLNSFNLHKNFSSGNYLNELRGILINDLTEVIGSPVQVKEFEISYTGLYYNIENHPLIESDDYDTLDFYGDDNEFFDFSDKTSFDILTEYSKFSPTCQSLQVKSTALRSNCRVTNQPDWGDVYIVMNGNKVPSKFSLLKYIISMRNENHFHEEICEMIYNDLNKFEPYELLVACFYTRRGGIDINPIRASNKLLLSHFASDMIDPNLLSPKTMRQ